MARVVYAALVLSLAVGASAAEVNVINAWAQCGGTSCQSNTCADAPWTDKQCTEGFSCVRMTSFFWQCKPEATMFGQCGGNGGACKGLCGDKAWAACPKGGACLRQTSFYWQCVKQEDVEALQKQHAVQSVSIAAVDTANAKGSPPKKPQAPVAPATPAKVASTKSADSAAKVAPAKPALGQQQKHVGVVPQPAAAVTPAQQHKAVGAEPEPAATVTPPGTTVQTPAANGQTKPAPRFSWPWSKNSKP